jgi:hypothetical protein
MTLSVNVVDYEQVTRTYESGLSTQLRGFRGGARFLEHWVHDPDPVKSIVNIIEAAETAGLADVTVVVGARTCGALDTAQLGKLAAGLGQVAKEEREDGFALTVRFARAASAASGLGGVARERARRAREARDARLRAEAQRVEPGAPRDGLHPIYREGVARILAAGLAHEGMVDAAPGLERLEAGNDGWVLGALVDPSTHRVRAARFRGGQAQARGLLEGLCSIMEGKPLIECADHAVIRLEHRLRDHARPRPVAGIVTPESVEPAFVPLCAAVRRLMAEYRRRTGYAETENRFDPEASPGWQALTPEERLAQIQAALDGLGAPRGLSPGAVVCTRLDRSTRATVEFHAELPAREKARLMMDLERALKNSVEATIHLYQEEMHDKNRIRRL